ncbi:unnamed protein product [Sphagnum jensenii]|uniref:Uncharacterized protein n=1 Tax=Sphagnum jensenii TaxID=128206 RepID=A0ABP1BST0_9BRYO
MEKERRVKEALVEERDTWKDMFLKALKSMEGLEKEIAQNESEIANLKSQLQAAASEKVDNPCSDKKENSLLSQNDTIAKDLASNLASERENLQNELMDVKLKLEATGAYLHKSLQENIRLEGEKESEKQQQAVLAAAFDGVKREVEAVVSATEAFKTEAVLNMQVLRADVQKVQAASHHKVHTIRSQLQRMEHIMNTQNGVLKTLATEQKVLHDISVARAAVQETTLSSMQQLLHLEQVSGRKIKEAFCLIDLTGGRDKVMMIESSRDHHLHHQQAAAAAAAAVAVSSNPLLEGVAKKHTQELMEAEKKLGITNLERLEQAQDVATMELCSVQPQDKKGHQKSLSLMDRQILLMGNSFAVDETEETASAGTTAQEMCRVTTDIRMGGNSVHCRSKEQPKRRHEESKQQREIVAKRTPLPQPIRSRENIWSLQH